MWNGLNNKVEEKRMTEYEHFMLQMCFSMLLGYTCGMLLTIITDTIGNIKERRKSRKEKSHK